MDLLSPHFSIHFEQATFAHKKLIFHWLQEPHIQEFWDNSQEHKDDIINFMEGRITSSNYFNGSIVYWVGFVDKQPFCFILSSILNPLEEPLPEIYKKHLSDTGKTICLDFGIGNTAYLGKGLAALTLQAFTEHYYKNIDPNADTFFIDPEELNFKAKHVYEKADFQLVGNYNVDKGVFKSKNLHLLVKKID